MNTKSKKLISLLLVLFMLMSIMPVSGTAFAETTTGTTQQTGVSISLTKLDEDESPLGGAVFELSTTSGSIVYEATSDSETGDVTFNNVANGTYILSETKAPDGYAKTDKEWTFYVDNTKEDDMIVTWNGEDNTSNTPVRYEVALAVYNEPIEPTITIEIPIEKVIVKGGNVTPPRETFEFEVSCLNTNFTEFDVTNNTITVTNGVSGSTIIKITVPGDAFSELFAEGILITECNNGGVDWTYSTEAYYVLPSVEGDHIYYLESDTPEGDDIGDEVDRIVFTNTYNVNEDDLITLDIPFEKIVENGGNQSDAEDFTFEVTTPNNEDAIDNFIITGNTVATNGAKTYDGTITIKGTQEAFWEAEEAFLISEKDNGAANWEYDDTRWFVQISGNANIAPMALNQPTNGDGIFERIPNYTVEIYEVTDIIETDNGTSYDFDYDNPKKLVSFTNTYTRNKSYSGGGSVTVKKPELNKEDHFAFMAGYPDGTFGPSRNITRGEAAAMFARLLTEQMEDGVVYKNTFSDVPADLWSANAIGYVQQFGLIAGYEDGTFRPQAPITRAEFAAIACRFEKLAAGDAVFSDVAASHWAYNAINFAATRGWVSGYEDGTFRPNANITRAEVVSVTCRLLERNADQAYINANYATLPHTYSDMSKSHWAFYSVMEASNSHDYVVKDKVETWESTSK